MTEVKRPILVTGSHRSGTTWAGRMLCLSDEAGYIHEPFNPLLYPGWGAGRVPYWFLYVTEANERFYSPLFDDILAFRYHLGSNLAAVRGPKQAARLAQDLWAGGRHRLGKVRPLLKDPIALFSSPWIHQRYDADVLVMIRRPVAFAGSLKRLDWQFRFRGWLAQEELMTDHLRRWAPEMHRLAAGEGNIVDQAILMWNAMHTVIAGYKERFPEWRFARHEDLARDPAERFESLYRSFGLTWGPEVARRVLSFSEGTPGEVPIRRHGSVKRDSGTATDTWKARLTESEKERVLTGTAEVARLFYEEDELSR